MNAGRYYPIFGLALVQICAFAQLPTAASSPSKVKTTLCEIARNPAAFDGKVVQMRAVVDTGVLDLPGGVIDDSCSADVKFFMPGDPQFSQLVKSKGFKKLLKDVKKHPVVEATVTGLFKRFGTAEKPDNRLALESVEDVAAVPQPRAPAQKR